MAQVASITAFDGATTPVSHTFTGMGIKENGSLAEFQELSSSIPWAAQARIKLSKSTTKAGNVIATYRVEVPIQEVVTGSNSSGYSAAPKVAFVEAGEIRIFAHPRSTPSGRRLVRQLLINGAGNVTTSVAAATSGPVPDLMDWLTMPT